MHKWAYDYTDKELVQEFTQATARAGTSNSGLVIDFMAGSHRAEAYYLQGVLLARLAGVKPAFNRNETVKLIQPNMAGHVPSENSVSSEYSDHRYTTTFNYPKEKEFVTIERIWYIKDKWYLQFKEINEARFDVEWFVRIEVSQDVAHTNQERAVW